MTRLDATFAALVAVQALHSVEEYVGRLWAVFPPAAFITGLVSQDRRLGFIVTILGCSRLVFGAFSGRCAGVGQGQEGSLGFG
jgi:hypothetical protein